MPVLLAYFRRESILAARYNKVVLPMYGVTNKVVIAGVRGIIRLYAGVGL